MNCNELVFKITFYWPIVVAIHYNIRENYRKYIRILDLLKTTLIIV